MSKNLKIRRNTKAGYRHIQKVVKNIVENMLQKTLFSNCHVKFIFPMALAVAGSALGLILFLFSFCLLFHDARKNLSFQTNNLISENKICWGNRQNMQDLFQRISWSGKWTQMVSNLNVSNQIFPAFVFSHWKKSNLIFIASVV